MRQQGRGSFGSGYSGHQFDKRCTAHCNNPRDLTGLEPFNRGRIRNPAMVDVRVQVPHPMKTARTSASRPLLILLMLMITISGLVELQGLEPWTSSMPWKRSSQLSYSPLRLAIISNTRP